MLKVLSLIIGFAVSNLLFAASPTPLQLADKVADKGYVIVADLSRPSNQIRLFLVNLDTNTIEYSGYTSHGEGSAKGQFSNRQGSKMSSPGLYRVGELYYGKHGLSAKLDGLDSTNSNARQRSIVLHAAYYVSEAYILKYGRAGMSWGCITLDPSKSKWVLEKVKNGGLLYVYVGR